MTFDDAPKSTRQLWFFLLKISKFNKNGEWKFDLSLIKMASDGSI